MAGFTLRKGHAEVEEATISSLTLAIGDLIELDVGATAWTVGDSATEHWQRKGVCMEAATSSDTKVKVLLVSPDQEWEVESANSSSADDNGDRMVLTDKNTVNNSGTDSTAEEAVVIQIAPVGSATDNKILVRFFDSTGINPDAA